MGASGAVYVRTRVVSPGATDAESGNALRAAIAGITDGKAWRVKLEPGVYELGATPLYLKSGISLEGSGEGITLVRANVDAVDAGTLVGVADSQVSQLSVENTGGGAYSIALYSEDASFTFHDVTATARNGSSGSFTIYVKGAQGTFERVHAFAFSTGYANGFRCRNCAARLHESTSEARGGTQGVGIYTADGSLAVRNVRSAAIGATKNWGIYTDGELSLSQVEALGSGGTLSNGLFVGEGNATVLNSVVTATAATRSNEGLATSTNYAAFGLMRTVTLHHTLVTGSTTGIYRSAYFNIRLAGSQVTGSIAQSDPVEAGRYSCVGTYDGSFAPVTCP